MRREPKYSPEVIRRYREQDFRQRVTKRVPVTLTDDEVTFECGHSATISATLLDSTDKIGSRLACYQCEKEWLAKENK